MAESVVSSVIQFLGALMVEEAKFLGGVADQVDNILDEMMQMQCFLKDADAKQHESESVRNLVADIRDVAYNAEDIIETYILKAKYANFFNPIRLHQIGKEIKTLQSKIQDITRRVATYNFIRIDEGEGTSSTTVRLQQLRQSYPHYDDEDVIGIEDNMKVLIAALINKKGPLLVSIVGMGGLGKTTLAKKIYSHGDVKRHFDCCSWSFISQQFQVRTILQGIIRKVSNPNEETSLERLSDEELKEKLFKLLEDKCYLVVLDDIWSTNAWDDLKPAFPKVKMGSKIMLTTRNKDVALYVDPLGFLHELGCLTNEQSWELFCKKAFPWKNVASSTSSFSYPPEADVDVEKKEKLGRDMIKKCGGLPLAIVALGGLLATKKSIHEWEMVAENIDRYLNKTQKKQEQYGVSWTLALSYHDLPSYLKPCFLYFGLYPEDTEIHKMELIQMWIAEGFMQHNGQGITEEQLGEEYLVELINRSIVQVGERSLHGKVKTCHLHDLMRDLCLQKAKEENFLCSFDGGSSTRDFPSSSSSISMVKSISNHRIRRHAIQFTCERYVSMQQPTRSSHLRAFSLWRPSNERESIVTIKFVCKNFNFLRVLVLEDIKIDSLPRAIGKLIHLRYLRLIRTYWKDIKVPESIGNLRSLQFLTLVGIKRLPNVLWKMEQLTYCCVRNPYSSNIWRVDGLKNLSTLELGVPRGKELLLGNAQR
ncbi:hypothetical protein NE237_011845 [Protea cynaroides]|uniref:Disease resistance protein n=1 Tax=Protea cynaroides TaxID=273540 RepID=A0A9Q0GZX2_9MAGN|nr:hypothetical protein NE237_011845 [Protea cynaroides]